jgi:hypothetical protein
MLLGNLFTMLGYHNRRNARVILSEGYQLKAEECGTLAFQFFAFRGKLSERWGIG